MKKRTNLEGAWCYPAASAPGETDVMCIDEARARMVTFVHLSTPELRVVTRHWTRRHSENELGLRLRPDVEWEIHKFKFEKGKLVWYYGDGVHPWRPLEKSEYPDWLETELATAHARMDAEEQRFAGGSRA